MKLVLAGTGDKGTFELIGQVHCHPSFLVPQNYSPKIKGNLTNHGAVLILLCVQIGGKGSGLTSEKPCWENCAS